MKYAQLFCRVNIFGELCDNSYYGQGDNKVFKYIFREAEDGDLLAMNSVAMCYEKGDSVEKNDAEALKWFGEAANKGYVEAQYNLGSRYMEGRTFPKTTTRPMNGSRKLQSKAIQMPSMICITSVY